MLKIRRGLLLCFLLWCRYGGGNVGWNGWMVDFFIEIVFVGEVCGGLEENGVVKVIGLGIVVKS